MHILRHMARLVENLDFGAVPRPLEDFDRAEIDRVALKAFFNLAEEWELSRDQAMTLLGSPSERTFYRWREGRVSRLPKDTLERISVMMGIYKAAHILLPVIERANAYVKRPNTSFGGESALDIMLKGRVDNLYQVRRHLDAWRG